MILSIVGAVIRDVDGRLLVVRKRGTSIFMLPGGKPEPGETNELALSRELQEELGVAVTALSAFGAFEAPAANEPGVTVSSTVFIAEIEGAPTAAAEIAELAWIAPKGAQVRLAPLLEREILPRLQGPVSW